jgi:hypothetical protein
MPFESLRRFQSCGAKHEVMVAMAKELFDVVQSGVVKINLNQAYPLKDVSKGVLRSPKRARPPFRPVLTIRGLPI